MKRSSEYHTDRIGSGDVLWAVYQPGFDWLLFASQRSAIAYLESLGAVCSFAEEWDIYDQDGELQGIYVLASVVVQA